MPDFRVRFIGFPLRGLNGSDWVLKYADWSVVIKA